MIIASVDISLFCPVLLKIQVRRNISVTDGYKINSERRQNYVTTSTDDCIRIQMKETQNSSTQL